MIFVDSSVWIDLFNQRTNPQTARLTVELQKRLPKIAVGDLVAYEVLRGIGNDKRRAKTWQYLKKHQLVQLVGFERARRAAERYAELRTVGRTVRKTNDVLIASYCLDEGLPLLFSDKDFVHFVEHFGMRKA